MPKEILVITAHQDDEVLGAGGTIAKMTKRGDNVAVLFVTEGTSSQFKEGDMMNQKKEQAKKAAEILGIKKVIFADLPDMKLDALPQIEINKVIEQAVREIMPEVVITHSYKDLNHDHQKVHLGSIVACRQPSSVKKLLTFEVPSPTEWRGNMPFAPNYYEDITEYLALKLKAFECYGTEIREYPHPRSPEGVKILAQKRGLECYRASAEAFELLFELRK